MDATRREPATAPETPAVDAPPRRVPAADDVPAISPARRALVDVLLVTAADEDAPGLALSAAHVRTWTSRSGLVSALVGALNEVGSLATQTGEQWLKQPFAFFESPETPEVTALMVDRYAAVLAMIAAELRALAPPAAAG